MPCLNCLKASASASPQVQGMRTRAKNRRVPKAAWMASMLLGLVWDTRGVQCWAELEWDGRL